MLEVLGVSEIADSLKDYAEEYENVQGLIRDMEEGALICVDRGDGVYTDIRDVFPDHNYHEKMLNDLQVYLIEIRKKIRDKLDADEMEQTGTVTQKPSETADAYMGVYPKNDYRRHSPEDKEDDLK